MSSWLDYTINVQQTRQYNIDLQVFEATGGGMHINIDGQNVSGPLQEQLDGFNLTSGIRITRGTHVLRAYFDTPGSGGDCSELERIRLIPVPRYPAADQTPRDTSFGSGGSSTVTYANTSCGGPVAIGRDPEGKLLVYDRTNAVIARLQENGVPDSTFTAPQPSAASASESVLMKTLPNGKIVGISEGTSTSTHFQIVLRGYNSDGKPDLTFGHNGVIVNMYSGQLGRLQDMAIQRDGKIIVAGTVSGPDSDLATVWRFESNGYKDNAFANRSVAKYAMPARSGFRIETGIVLIQRDGKIVYVGGVQPDFYSTDSILRIRLNVDGSLNAVYPNGGVGSLGHNSTGDAAALLQPNGKLVIAAEAINPDANLNDHIVLSRFNTDGSNDTSFGKAGRRVIRFDAASGAILITKLALLKTGDFALLVGEQGTSVRDTLIRLSRTGVITSVHSEPVNQTSSIDDILVAPDGTIFGVSNAGGSQEATTSATLFRFQNKHAVKP